MRSSHTARRFKSPRAWISAIAIGLFAIAARSASAEATAGAKLAEFQGHWAFRVKDKDIFILTLGESAGPANQIGAFERPTRFQLNPARGSISGVHMPVLIEPIELEKVEEHNLYIVTRKLDGSDDDHLQLTMTQYGALELRYAGLPLPPITLTSVGANQHVAADLKEGQTYAPDDTGNDNALLSSLYNADQSDRNPSSGKLDSSLAARDISRRNIVKMLISTNKLNTGTDYNNAAFILQHGDDADDYIVAHTLAMIAVKKGRPDSIWIAAATLDRYLQSVGKPQIYGTQYKTKLDTGNVSQDPYNKSLISDALRAELGVPALSQQIDLWKSIHPPGK